MKQEVKERFARLGPLQAIGRDPSALPVDVVIRPDAALSSIRTIDATHALVRRGVSVKVAQRAVEDMVETGRAVIELSTVEQGNELAVEMRAAGVSATRIKRLKPVNVREVREKLGMSAAVFAKVYHLNQRTIEGWEAGRAIPDVANTYLYAIATNPDLIERSFEEQLG